MSKYTKTKESATRKKIDIWLNNLGWNTDEESPDCNVFTERLKTKEQQDKLEGKEPDYSLYKSGTDELIGIIEAKRKGEKIKKTLENAIKLYVKPLNIPIVFASDGSFVKTWHNKDNKELIEDSEPVNELLSEKKVLRYIKEGSDIESIVSEEIKYTREQLISVFKWANDLLRKEGIREGFDRFIEFANLLFLKLISEMEIDREENNEERILENKYCWNSFANLSPDTMMEYINGTVLPHLGQRYNRSGDVFQSKLGISNSLTLKQIVDKLSRLKLINIKSDIKGDAFEYFLKNAVTVGNDLGEYFTPRHIVRLMVKLVNPQFGDKVYDPTCGTGGFLIDAFRHIKKSCKHTKENLKILQEKTVFGKELTNTARIAKMNMILTGDGHTNIEQMDCLQKPVKNLYDVVLANPPYGQNTDWGNLYPVHSNNADCIFIQHVMLSLNETGKACIIVPEGFLFRGGVDNKTRKYLIDNFNLISIISLPAGVFYPYTGSKTNILVFERGKTEQVWFYDIHNDGFELGATRRPIQYNDIPDLIKKWEEKSDSENSWSIKKDILKEHDWDLTIGKYKPTHKTGYKYPYVELKEIGEFINGRANKPSEWDTKGLPIIRIQNLTGQTDKFNYLNSECENKYIVNHGDILISWSATIGVYKWSREKAVLNQHIFRIELNEQKIDKDYFYYVMGGIIEEMKQKTHGVTMRHITKKDFLQLKIPLPPLEIQKEYAKRLNKHKIIIENLESTINSIKNAGIDDSLFINTNIKTLKEICSIITDGTHFTPDYKPTGIPFIRITDIKNGYIDFENCKHISQEKHFKLIKRCHPKCNDILYSKNGTIGIALTVDTDKEFSIFVSLALLRSKNIIIPKYLEYYLNSDSGKKQAFKHSKQVTVKNLHLEEIEKIEVPVPPIEIQQEIIDRINRQNESIKHLEILREETKNTMQSIIDELFSPEGSGFYPIPKQKKLVN